MPTSSPPHLSQKEASRPIVLVGCGKMGGSLLARWQTAFPELVFHVVDPSPPECRGSTHAYTNIADLPPTLAPALIVLAVKPQAMPDVAPLLMPWAAPGTAFLSIAAGIKQEKLRSWLGPSAEIIRAMPNTPAAIGQGMSVLTAEISATSPAALLATRLMSAAGLVLWADNESQMDAVTALSGSGPAYLFALTEAMAEAGKALGLPADMAETLARQTIIGSAALMAEENNKSPATLREAVTSKGGTTAAALAVFQRHNALQELVTQALTAAAKRSEELSA